MDLVDAHCHLQDKRLSEAELPAALATARAAGVSTFVVNGCWPGDWERVLSLAQAHPGAIIPQLGLHPWWVARRAEDLEDADAWLPRLRSLLEAHPTAGLGECGLDKGPRGLAAAPWEDQLAAFRVQLTLAESLRRPVSVHCVRAFGAVHDILTDLQMTVPVVLHAWSGTAEMTTALLKLPTVFFSLGGHLTRVQPARGVAMLRVLSGALDRCMLESDAPDGGLQLGEGWVAEAPTLAPLAAQLTAESGSEPSINPPASTRHMLTFVAAVMERTDAEVAAATAANARRVFCSLESPLPL